MGGDANADLRVCPRHAAMPQGCIAHAFATARRAMIFGAVR
jgi:hypothetical protein